MCPPSSQFSSHRMYLLEISITLHTPLESLKRRPSFIDNGGDSFSSTRLQIAFRSHGIKISLDTIFLAPTLLHLADNIATAVTRESGEVSTLEACRRGKTRHEDVSQGPTKRRRISIPKRTEHKSSVSCRTYPMTEMQLSLVQSSLRNPILNVIVYFETHPTDAIQALKHAWNTVLGAEPLFNTIAEVDETGGYFLEREEMQIDWREMLMEDEESYRNYLNCAPSESPTLGISFEVVTFKLPQRVSQSTIIWRVHHTSVDGT
jgi:aryl carrier-like protein